jgi:hypothetical protein
VFQIQLLASNVVVHPKARAVPSPNFLGFRAFSRGGEALPRNSCSYCEGPSAQNLRREGASGVALKSLPRICVID